MGIALITFIAAFLAISYVGFAVAHRKAALSRLARVVEPPIPGLLSVTPPPTPGARIAKVVESFERVLPKSSEEVSVAQQRLIRAGYREKGHIRILYGAKVLAPLLFCVAATVTGAYTVTGPFIYVMALGLGYLAPDFWLGNRIKARQTNLRLGLPEALDLMVICIEAGLGLDRSVLRTSEELKLSQPEIANELELVCLEHRAGRPRAEAWKNLAERTDVESVRSLVSILIQADKFGTSVGKTLRAHADTLRTRRRQDAEEQAAKTTVKLIFPLVLCIFPALFVVTLGPSMLAIMDSLQNFLN
jgi:tight adherence protein C